jgi:uncharacterized protein
MEPLTRFSKDLDGSMEPDEHGGWVRHDDAHAQHAAMTEERDLWRVEAASMTRDRDRINALYLAGLRAWDPVYQVQSEKLLQAQQELLQLRQNAQHDHATIASLYEELTDLSARPTTRS